MSGAPGAGRSLARRAFKPVYLLYYRFLFGRRFPFAGRLAARVRAFEAATGRGDAPAGKEIWEEQYRAGRWELMRGLDEVARYSVIAGYLHHLRPGGSVLDVGSGEGLLADHLRPFGYARYLGVDLSEVAIGQAAGRADAATAFAAADAETFEPSPAGASWDAIVFNECVYYFVDPLATVRRYEAMLAADGILIVSTFRSRRADVIVERLLAGRRLLEETAITNRKGTWVVRVIGGRPRTSTD
jgi:2-polyprenyl-6-hydroxyphenyl methylase/3-demethylubiquinone-9 3-methyltransferase